MRFLAIQLLGWACFSAADPIKQLPGSSTGLPLEATGSPFDWAKLNTDEWIKGDVLSMYFHTLRFKSQKFKLREFDWEDIRRLVTAKPYVLGFETGPVVTGRLDIDRTTVTVFPTDGQPVQRFNRAELVSISPAVAKEIELWTADITLSANLRGGNSDQQIYQGDVDLRRRKPKSRVVIDYVGNYTKTGGDSSVNNHSLDFGYDRLITNRFFVRPIGYTYFRDPFKNISQRHTLIPGVGYIVLDTPRSYWSLVAGLGYQRVKYQSVPEGDPRRKDTPVFSPGTHYELEITDDLDVETRYLAAIVNDDAGQYIHIWVTRLNFDLTTLLDLNVTFGWERVQEPRTDSDGDRPDKDDYYLLFGLRIRL